jgi:predicted peptidase
MNRSRTWLPLLAVVLLSSGIARADEERLADRFEARTFKTRKGRVLPYRLFVPEGYDPRKSYPLVLWLHSGGGSGDDNVSQITRGSTRGANLWTRPEHQARQPAFVVAPQCPRGGQWAGHESGKPTRNLRAAVELIGALREEFNVDGGRVYVVGQSLGGFGAWAAITHWPRLFAAAIPVCGGGNEALASRLVDEPIWAFHGERDDAVNVGRSRKMIAAIRAEGGEPRYTEYPGAGHAIWPRVFREPRLVWWLFSQRNNRRPER